MPPTPRCALLCLLSVQSAVLTHAQDPFEIQVYEYETVPKGMLNLETHVNYVGKGVKFFEGPVYPTNNQLHLTYELTRGITDHFELAGYLVLGRRPGQGPLEYAGARIRPRYRFPERWGLPVKISLSAEVGFPRRVFEENSVTLEVRPIVERSFGKLQLDLNPVIGRALRGPGTSDGWDFEPSFRIAYKASKRVEPSLEYYGSYGPITGFRPVNEQVHLFYPGADINVTENIVWNVGVGLAATPEGNQLTFKRRLGVLFGKPRP